MTKSYHASVAALRSLRDEFISKYRSRIVSGLAKYGEFDPATDKRVLSVEAQEECLDIGSYLEFLESKYNSMSAQVQKVRAKTILLYGDLKKLEAEERTLSERGIE